MTISSEPVPLSYDGDDSTVNFAISWKYFAKSDVRVTHRSTTGVETTWVLDSNYTLTAAGVEAGGTLTATTAPATGGKITIELDTPNTQTTSLPLGGAIPSSDVEDAIDRITQIAAKLEQLFNRSLRVPRTDTQTGDDLELPNETDRASAWLAFDASGNPIASAVTTGEAVVSAFMETLLDDTDAVSGCKTLSAVHVLDKDVSINTLTSTNVETTVYSFQVPANTLGTNRCIRLTIHMDLTTAATPDIWSLRIKYGSTTLLTLTASFTAGITANSPAIVVVYLFADGATNSQVCVGTNFASDVVTFAIKQHLTSAEDSTGALNLVATLQCSTGTGSSANVYGVFTELLP